MFTIKNLLKISFLFSIIFTLLSCKKTHLINEDARSAFGYYAYNKGDSVKMIVLTDKDTDTVTLFVVKNIYISSATVVYYDPIEICEIYLLPSQDLNLVDYFDADTFVSVYLGEKLTIYSVDLKIKNTLLSLGTDDIKKMHFYEQKKIDGKIYDSAYYFIDYPGYNWELTDYMYSSKRYGFIKFWNDTVTIKFER